MTPSQLTAVVEQAIGNAQLVRPQWFNTRQASIYLGYESLKAFRNRLNDDNPPPSVKLGRQHRFNRDDLDRWMRGGAS